MRTFIQSMVGLGLIAMFSTPALAQGRGFGGRGFGGLGMLLSNATVQKELKLDEAQVEKAKEVAEKAREKMTEMRETLQGLDQEERRTKQAELMKEMNESTLKAVGAFLKAEQVTRLKQISYQQRGLQAFNDPEIAKKLNLTDTQKTDIQAISQETMESSRGLISQDSTPEERAEGMKKIAEIRKAALTKVETKLMMSSRRPGKSCSELPSKSSTSPVPTDSRPFSDRTRDAPSPGP